MTRIPPATFTAREVNLIKAFADQAVIAIQAANAMQDDREMCLAVGMDDYVTKPIRVDTLVQALRAVTLRQVA